MEETAGASQSSKATVGVLMGVVVTFELLAGVLKTSKAALTTSQIDRAVKLPPPLAHQQVLITHFFKEATCYFSIKQRD